MTTESAGGGAPRRASLGIHFRCCHVYGYIYKNRQGDAFTGRCPKCGMPIRVEIAKNGQGSPSRIFQTG